jgi:hypothetical protein
MVTPRLSRVARVVTASATVIVTVSTAVGYFSFDDFGDI